MTIGREPTGGELPSVLVLGGGRWARVITQVLLPIVARATRLRMASPHGAADLRRWAESIDQGDRIEVLHQRPEQLPPGSVVIVANASHNHVQTALWAMEKGASVLVEKPFALSRGEAQSMIDAAARHSVLLAPAMVFRFASYLDGFAAELARRGPMRRAQLVWIDAASEHRYGEAKRYDPGVSVLEDCLPHVVSVFHAVFGALPELENLLVERGGAKVSMALAAGPLACSVLLERNGAARQRHLKVLDASGFAELDFTEEPGVLQLDGAEQARTSWTAGDRPLACMISAFLKAAAGGVVDERFSMQPALHASRLSEESMSRYRQQVIEQLGKGLAGPNLDYAVAELVQRPGRLPEAAFERAAAELRRRLGAGAALGGAAEFDGAVGDARRHGLQPSFPH